MMRQNAQYFFVQEMAWISEQLAALLQKFSKIHW